MEENIEVRIEDKSRAGVNEIYHIYIDNMFAACLHSQKQLNQLRFALTSFLVSKSFIDDEDQLGILD